MVILFRRYRCTMRELIELLNQKERRIVYFILVLFLVSLVFFVFFAQGEKNVYSQSHEDLLQKQKKIQTAERTLQEKRSEWMAWREARQDMDEFRNKFLFEKTGNMQELRLTLDEIFKETKVKVTKIRYDYDNLKEENIRRVRITFNISGNYYFLKRFIYLVENLPKLIIIENIDFMDVNPQGGEFKLKVILVGYYES